jgi:DNA-binding PadR family transcriptional regulator
MLPGPKYGYQLKKESALIIGQELHSNLVYPSLRRFLAEGWVSKKAVPGDRGQTRQQYAISAKGRRHLFARMSEFGESDAASEDAFHLRLGLFEALKPEVRQSILGQRENWLQRRDHHLAALQASMELGRFGGEIVRHRRRQVEIELEWIGRLRRIERACRKKANV